MRHWVLGFLVGVGGCEAADDAMVEDTDVGDDGSSGEPEPSPYDGAPLSITRDGAWQWVDLEGVHCADGRQSGVGIRAVENSAGLVVYFRGGGACFNLSSCGLTEPLAFTGMAAIRENPDGVLDFDNPDGPLYDYDIVYVPYCTGDVHAGSVAQGRVEGVDDPWDFIGHQNLLTVLDRVAPTFADASRVVVLGTSAGGIGALVNFPSIARGWPDAEHFLLDDSGAIFGDDYLAPCLQRTMRDTWGLDQVMPPDCPDCLTDNGGGMAQYYAYLADRYPDAHFGLVASSRDRILRIFFGYGNDDCTTLGIPDLGEDVMKNAVTDLHQDVLAGRFATYVVDSDVHVWTATPAFYTVESAGVPLTTWVDAFLAGEAYDVVPPG